MQISLRPELQRFIQAKVSDGSFADANDVVSAALVALQSQEVWDAKDVAELRQAVAVGTDELDRGDSGEWDVDQLKADGRKVLARRQRDRLRRQKGPR